MDWSTLTLLTGSAGESLAALVPVHLRLLGFFLTLPALGERILTPRIKVSLALLLTPLVHDALPAAEGAIALGALLANLVIGLACGMLVRLLALALDMATAAIAATASLSQILGAVNEASPHPIGNHLHLAGLALLMALGFPLLATDLVLRSFELWPVNGWPSVRDLSEHAAYVVSGSFQLAMLMAAPFILGGFLYQALAGVVSKTMPQLPIALIGAPASILLALVALAVLSPLILQSWAAAVFDFGFP